MKWKDILVDSINSPSNWTHFENLCRNGIRWRGQWCEANDFNHGGNTYSYTIYLYIICIYCPCDFSYTDDCKQNCLWHHFIIFQCCDFRFRTTGGLSNWDRTEPSVWLTAWVIRLLSHVKFQDWEDYVYIDPTVGFSLAFILHLF